MEAESLQVLLDFMKEKLAEAGRFLDRAISDPALIARVTEIRKKVHSLEKAILEN